MRACRVSFNSREVVAERLLHDDAGVLGQARVREAADDHAEERRWDFEVEDGELRALDLLGHASIGRRVREVAVDVREPGGEALEDGLVKRLARRDDRVACAIDQMLERPVVERDADDRTVE
jgi:hypothetical protein